MILEYKLRPKAKAPTRANPSDAGLDVFYCPKDPNVSAVTINPGENHLLPTGLTFGVPHGYMLQVCNRSSMGAKRSLIVGAHIVDSGYDGEVFIDLHNIGTEVQYVNSSDKIAQLVLIPVVHFRPRLIEAGSLYSEEISISNREDGALGSTDKKAEPKEYASTAELDIRDRYPKKNESIARLIREEGWSPNGF
jgi:dUTP pyrophosphatase